MANLEIDGTIYLLVVIVLKISMITADQAYKIKTEHKTMSIVARQREYIYTHIEGEAKLGKSKYRWISPDELTKEEIGYILESLRDRGFEIARDGTIYNPDGTRELIYNILW